MKRLLILACSQRKQTSHGLLPAIERYNGPTFQLLRRYLTQNHDTQLDICILSAKFGLIAGDMPIPYYDQKMHASLANSWRPTVQAKLRRLSRQHTYSSSFISVGKEYAPVLEGLHDTLFAKTAVKVASGSMGKRLSELHQWLYNEVPSSLASERTNKHGAAHIRGISLSFTPQEIIDLVRKKIADDQRSSAYQTWYVQVDDQRVSPKWLVSQLSGLAVKDFHSDEARRVLHQLGIEVLRA